MMLRTIALKQLAFAKRGIIIEAGYTTNFALDLASVSLPIISLYFMGRMIGQNAALVRYGGNYFEFAFVGVVASQYFSRSMRAVTDTIGRAQSTGVLEATLSTPTRPSAIAGYEAIFGFGICLTSPLIATLFAWGVLGLRFRHVNATATIVVALLLVGTFMALAVLSCSAVIAFKKGDPVQFLWGGLGSLLSGALFPVDLLPRPLQVLARVLPSTHGLEALRLTLFSNASLSDVRGSVLVLATMCAVLVPSSLFAFELAVERGRRDGTLLHH